MKDERRQEPVPRWLLWVIAPPLVAVALVLPLARSPFYFCTGWFFGV